MADKVFRSRNFPGSSNTQTQKNNGDVMTQQGDAVAGELATEKVGIKGIWLFFSP